MRPLEEIAADLETASTWATGPKARKIASLAAELRGEEVVEPDKTGAATSVVRYDESGNPENSNPDVT